jgi:hypothetical protein
MVKKLSLLGLSLMLCWVGAAAEGVCQDASAGGMSDVASHFASISWISNVGGIGLTALLVLNVIPGIVKTQADALKDVAGAVTLLRVHCASRTGEPGQEAPAPRVSRVPSSNCQAP